MNDEPLWFKIFACIVWGYCALVVVFFIVCALAALLGYRITPDTWGSA